MKKIVRISRVLCQILLVGALLVAYGCQKEVNRDKPIGKVSYNYFDTVSYVYDYTNDTEKELYTQMNEKAKNANDEEKAKLKTQYMQMQMAKNKVPDFIKLK